MNGTVTLTTERLVLRKESKEDISVLYESLGQDPQITRYTGWNPYSTPEAAREKVQQDIMNYEKEGFYSWIIEYKGNPVGTVGAYDYDADASSIEIGYTLGIQYSKI